MNDTLPDEVDIVNKRLAIDMKNNENDKIKNCAKCKRFSLIYKFDAHLLADGNDTSN